MVFGRDSPEDWGLSGLIWIRKNRDFSRFFKVVPAEGLEPPPDFKWPKTAFLLAF